MKHKIVFFDMDGTLYQGEKDLIQDSTLAAIARLKQAGYLIGAVTGRPLNQMKQILDRVQFDYYVLLNGGYILDSDLQLISSNPLSAQDTLALVDLAAQNELGLMLQFGDASYIYSENYPWPHYSKYAHVPDAFYFDQTGSFHRRHQAYNSILLTRNAQLVQDFVSERPHLGLDLIKISSNGLAYELYDARSRKASGIESVLDHLGLGWQDVIAFGDSLNDIEMLQRAGLGIAMGSARDEVKQAANRITTTVSNNGIFNAIKAILAEEDI